MTTRIGVVLALFGAALPLACGTARSAPAEARAANVATPAWQSTLNRDHRLVGKIWDARSARFTGRDEMEGAIVTADYVILGEKHDNPDHHELERSALATLIAHHRSPAVVLEMLDADQAPVIAASRRDGVSAAQFGAAVDWEKRGWPTYAWYAPIIAAALDAQLPILPANMPIAEVRALVRKGRDALAPETLGRLGLDQALPAAQAKELAEEMRAAHCGHLPEAMLEPMALAQRARDAHMALAMLDAKTRPVLLLAGNGHARADRAVPAFLRAHAETDARVVSVSFQEVDPGSTTPGRQPYDFVVFTPRASDEDPCAKMR